MLNCGPELRATTSRRKSCHFAWLAGASVIALTLASAGAYARPLGGGAQPTASAASTAAAQSAQQEATRAAQAASNSLRRATLAIQAQQASQQAARDAARATQSTVPNGLKPGGLQVAPGAVPGSDLWQGANLPTESTVGARTRVGIEQTQQKAILTWQTFNVGKDTDLVFDQKGNRDWIALNRVLDPSLAPSRILGSIKADGAVYVINRNGIIFDGTSQVNVATLVASALSLSNEQFMAGIGTALDARYPDGSPGMGSDFTVVLPTFGDHGNLVDYNRSAAQQTRPAFVPATPPGDVTVKAGAIIETATGGKAMLFAPRVTNAGTISAQNGQIIMAAGEQVYLHQSLAVRGFDVAVSSPMPWLFPTTWVDVALFGDVENYNYSFVKDLKNWILPAMDQRAADVGYSVVNDGIVNSARGDITLQAREIAQNGIIRSNTALNNQGGSVRLQAWSQGSLRYFIDGDPIISNWRAGKLVLGQDSVIMVEPDLTDVSEIEKSAVAARYEAGRVELRGFDVIMRSGASLIVPAGKISVVASAQPSAPEGTDSGGVADGSRIYIGEDAYISVAGFQDIMLAMSRNFVEAELRANELRDSPLYRDSWLKGQKVVIDRRQSGIFEDGPMAGVEWISGKPGGWVGTPLGDVSAWIGVGKTDLAELSTKGGSIVVKSGGSLITRKGSILDVSGGSVRYADGWNTATKLLGADGRVYDIGAAMPDQVYVALADGFTRQHARWGVTETWTTPLGKGSRRYERGYTEGRDAGSIQFYAGEGIVLEGSYWGGTVVGERQAASDGLAKAGTLTFGGAIDKDRVWLLGELVIAKDPVLLPQGFDASAPLDQFWYSGSPGDQDFFRKKTTYLDSDILIESGLGNINLYVSVGFELGAGEKLELGAGTELLVAANTSAGSPTHFLIDGVVRTPGGKVTLRGNIGEIAFGSDAAIDVSGRWINELVDGFMIPNRRLSGGSITIQARAFSVSSSAVLDVSGGGLAALRLGKIEVEGGDAGTIDLNRIDAQGLNSFDLRGYAAGSGGTLKIDTDAQVQLGGDAPASSSAMHIGNSLFSDRGFSSLTVSTSQGVTVPDGARLTQVATSIDLTGRTVRSSPSDSAIAEVGQLTVVPLWQRMALAASSLRLEVDGNVVMGGGASLTTDVRGSVNISAANITVDGAIETPAGLIVLNAPTGNIALGNAAALLARGVPVIQPGGRGSRFGEVLGGGSVSLSSATYAMGTGTLIDVSGASGIIDIGGRSPRQITLASDGGSISFTGGGVVRGRMLGQAGGINAVGGTLSVSNEGGGGGSSPFDMLRSILEGLIPDDTNGDGKYTWEDSIGYDYSSWGLPSGRPFIFTQEFVDAIRRTPSLVVTKTAPSGSGQAVVDPTKYGLSPVDILELEWWGGVPEWNLYNVGAAVAGVPPAPTVIASVINNGGFANLALATSGKIELDGVSLSLARSISLKGAITSNGTSSTLTAPYIRLAGGDGANAPSLDGTLTLKSTQTDIHDTNSIRGYHQTNLQSQIIRFTSSVTNGAAGLAVDGDLILKSGVIYPGTEVNATVTAGNSITIQQNGAASLPLSAAGSLRLQAPVIVQNGTLAAPFGSITLDASSNLTLAAGSVTSVSGAGLMALYGTLLDGESWQVNPGTGTPQIIAAPPEKRITLNGTNVAVNDGAVVDISGGGDLQAWEFVPGPGGSHDILSMPGMFAILPSQAQAASNTGTRIWLAGGNGLAAGWYTLLPARYALLPGAYAIQMVAGSTSTISSAMAHAMPDGTVIMSGRLGDAFTGAGDQLSSSWRVMSGNVLRQYSEYNEAFANRFFSSDAFKLTQYRRTGQNSVTPRLPMDGGAVVFKATQELILEGSLRSGAAGGRGGLVDIAGSKIAILGAGEDSTALKADGYLVLDSASLSRFGASSLLIGGTRSGDPLGLRVEVSASHIVVRNDEASALTGPEITLAASGLVDVGANSVILAKGDMTAGAGDLVMTPKVAADYDDPDGWEDNNPADDILVTPSKDYGALIRVSTGDAVRVLRENVDTTLGGVISIGAGARLQGGKALLIDATQNTQLAGTASLSAKSLSVASGRIGFGGGNDGLVLSLETLAQLSQAEALTLRSYSSIGFHSSIDFGGAGLASVTLDAAGLSGYGTNNITVAGARIVLENSGGGTAAAGSGSGTLALTAGELILGRGTKTISGFGSVVLTGSKGIVGEGKGSLDAGAAAVTLATPLLTGRGAASQAVTTTGALGVIATGGTSTLTATDSLGSILSLSGGSVALSSRIVALGGAVEVTAKAGDAVIGAGSLIDVGGFAKQFFDVTEYADAGRISLTAVGGDVRLESGAELRLAAMPGGGSAGKLAVTASGGGTVVFDGAIAAQAGAGGKNGSFALDIDAVRDFAGLNGKLNAAGFFAARQFRIRSGDVAIGGLTRVDDFQLSADAGTVTITGTIDARTTYGGRIAISAGDDLIMESSASLIAGATDANLGSGRVTLETRDGRLKVLGGIIDVSGGERGVVRFRATREASTDLIKVDSLTASIIGDRSRVLEGIAVYQSTDGTVDSQWNAAATEANAFAASAAAIVTRLSGASGVAIMAGIEITSNNDLTLGSDLNLGSAFGSSLRDGSLTLRAAGNLNINGNISDGFSNASTTGALLTTRSWDLRLVAGADLTSASALAVTPLAGLAGNSGSIIVGSAAAGKVIRTGTGDIAVAAGRDLRFANVVSAIYTAGKRDTTTYADFTPKADAVYADGGGHLTVAAGGNIAVSIKSNEGQFFTDWLNRTGAVNANTGLFNAGPGGQSSWWIKHGAFQQGVAALGGGNVSVSAGGDLGNLVVALATSGRVHGGTTSPIGKVLQITNGGAMTVAAGGSILGGQYYAGRGEATIRAAALGIGREVTVSGRSASKVYGLAPVLALGDAVMTVTTAGDMLVQTVADPLLAHAPNYAFYSFMSGYTDRTAIKLMSVGGDVDLVNAIDLAGDNYGLSHAFAVRDTNVGTRTSGFSGVGASANRYPAKTRVTAFNGSVSNLGFITTMPSSEADLRILAESDVVTGSIVMARAAIASAPSPFNPFASIGDRGASSGNLDYILLNKAMSFGSGSAVFYAGNPDVLDLADDHEPSRVYARTGSIIRGSAGTSTTDFLGITTSEQTQFIAGTDIRDINFRLRNVHGTDVSFIQAGNDVLFGKSEIYIEGPGSLVLSAGRDIYAQTFEIYSTGNRAFDYTTNTPILNSEIKGLPVRGADITLMAGINGRVAYDAFTAAYLDPANVATMAGWLTTTVGGVTVPLYLTDAVETSVGGAEHVARRGLVSFVRKVTGETLAPLDAWARFNALPELTRQEFVREVYMQELRAAGRDQNETRAAGGYNRGYAAIATLFPGEGWKGNVQFGNGLVRTMSEGDIRVLTPGGGLQVASLNTSAGPGYGLVTLGYGHIDIFAHRDVVVNRSRILTFGGGDEIIWSTLGDIDAGRGAKTTRVPTRPEIVTDANGNTTIVEKPDIGGSGIGTIEGFAGAEPGDVDLIAPKGTVNAGDAGIRVAGNLNLAALYVVNAANIEVQGKSKGVPVVEGPNIGGLTEASNTAGAAAQQAAVPQQGSGNAQPSVIIVEVLGYGGGDGTTQDGPPDDRREKRSSLDSYDPNSAVHMLGNGKLSEDQKRRLTEDERKQLNALAARSGSF